MTTADAIMNTLISENVSDQTYNAANIVDVLHTLASANQRIATAITAQAAPGHDDTGGCITSLTEAVMGVTSAGCRIAEAINNLADAVRERV